MTDKGKELPSPPKKYPRDTRRGVHLSQVVGKNSRRREVQTVSGTVAAAMILGFTPSVIINFFDRSEPGISQSAVSRPAGRIDSGQKLVDERILAKSTFDVVYGKLDQSDRQIAAFEIEEQKKVIREHYLNYEVYNRALSYENLIWESCQKHNVPQDILLGMVIFESRADPFAVSRSGAKGLTQMMDEMAKVHGLSISGANTQDSSYNAKTDFVNGQTEELDHRFYPEKILDATCEELAVSYERWGDWSLAVWEWHAGAFEIYDNLRDYIFRHWGEQLEDMRGQSYEKSLELRRAYKLKIFQHKLNAFKLLADSQILAKYEGDTSFDYTQIYVKGVVASAEVFRQMQAGSLQD